MLTERSQTADLKFFAKDSSRFAADGIRIDVTFEPASEGEIKLLVAEAPEGYVAGWASTPTRDHYGHEVVSGAFDESIKKRGILGPQGIKFLIGHDSGKPAGVIKVLETRNGRLWIEAQFNLSISYVKDYYEAAKMNGGMNFSVGFFSQDYEWKEDDNEREYLQINRGDLVEVSAVTFPGNEECEMQFVKQIENGKPATMATFVKHLVASGHAKSRNEAQAIVDLVKLNIDLFAKSFKAADEQEDADLAERVNKILEDRATKEASEAAELAKQAADAEEAARLAKESEEAENLDEDAPVLEVDKLSELTAKIAKMRELLSPAATE